MRRASLCVARVARCVAHALRRAAALCVYSCLFMRFAWAVQVRAAAAAWRSIAIAGPAARTAADAPRRAAQPRNYLLFACHASNECVQARTRRRAAPLAQR